MKAAAAPPPIASAVRELAEIVVDQLEAAERRYSDEGTRRLLGRARALQREVEAAWPAPEAAAAAPPATLRAPERLGGPLRSQGATERTHFVVRRPLSTPNLAFAVGEAFPVQDIRAIRSYGVAYGVLDAETRPVETLDYVEVR